MYAPIRYELYNIDIEYDLVVLVGWGAGWHGGNNNDEPKGNETKKYCTRYYRFVVSIFIFVNIFS
jgi:hypothetical protein